MDDNYKYLTFDFEHTESVFRPWESGFIISCVAFCFNGERGVLWFDHKNVDFEQNPLDSWHRLQQMVNGADLVIGHNLKHDLIIAKYHGINFEDKKLWCSEVADYLIHGQDPTLGYGLDEVAKRRGFEGKIDQIKEYWKSGMHTYDIPYEQLAEYALRDVAQTQAAALQQMEEVQHDKLLKVIELQNEYIHSLSDMEINGLLIDKEKGEKLYSQEVKYIEDLETQLKELFGEPRLNLQSNDHLSAALYGGKAVIKTKKWITKEYKTKPETRYYEKEFEEEIQLPGIFKPLPKTETKKAGVYKTDKDTIALLKSHNTIGRRVKRILVDLSTHTKVAESLRGQTNDAGLLNKIARDGCVHTSFFNAFTSTGRLSSRNPNGQNFPREGTSPIKKCIIPRYDYIMQWDLSQIEWRDAAWQSQDSCMISEINNGVDQHISACVDLMELPFVSKSDPESKMNRTHAKIFNFRINKIVLTKPCEFRENLNSLAA
jgi:DNA polymerase-1